MRPRSFCSTGLFLVVACGTDRAGPPDPPDGGPAVASITLTSPVDSPLVRSQVQLVAVTRDSTGAIVTGKLIAWSSSDTLTAHAGVGGLVTGVAAGTLSIVASSEGKADTVTLVIRPSPLAVKGLWTAFESRGSPGGYHPGQALYLWDSLDAAIGTTVGVEIGAQMDAIKALGVNVLTIEIRATDPTYTVPQEPFPTCLVPPPLGASWPQPTAVELSGLAKMLDAAQARGLKLMVFLVARHHNDATRADATTWLGSLMDVLKVHPAFESIVLGGDSRTVDNTGDGVPDKCGNMAEPPLWLGPNSATGNYVRWAIDFGRSRGVPIQKLGASAIVGDPNTMAEGPAGPSADGGHLWDPVRTMKLIFDDLGVVPEERTYVLSWYTEPASGQDAAAWAETTIRSVMRIVGSGSGARVVMSEMGNKRPAIPEWTTPMAVARLAELSRKFGLAGGSLWRWTNYNVSEETDPTVQEPVKRRGMSYSYTATKDALVVAYAAP